MGESNLVGTYVSDETLERWDERREGLGISSRSEFVKMMTESGLKSFEREVEPDETKAEMRKQRNDLRRELSRTRDRVTDLEQQLHTSDREEILTYLSESPGASYEDIVQHIVSTTSGRVTRLLDEMSGSDITVDDDGQYYRRNE